MLSLFAEFITEFESSIAIILQKLFASSSVIFTSPYDNNNHFYASDVKVVQDVKVVSRRDDFNVIDNFNVSSIKTANC